MTYTIFMLISAVFTPVQCDADVLDYENIVNIAATECKYAKSDTVDEDLLWSLVEIEKKYNVPYELRGMILAAACMESGYNPNAKGDRKFSKSKKKPMAIGILQQWPIYEKMYGTVRTDPISAADTWMKHIVKMLPKVTKQCRYKSERRKWIAAWVTGIRYKKKGGRCKERPKHLRLLNKWHRTAKIISCEDGC
jgi:hypothetical protein